MFASSVAEQFSLKIVPIVAGGCMAAGVWIMGVLDNVPGGSVIGVLVAAAGVAFGAFWKTKPQIMAAETQRLSNEAQNLKEERQAVFDLMTNSHAAQIGYYEREIKKLVGEVGLARLRADTSERLAYVERMAKHDLAAACSSFVLHIAVIEEIAKDGKIEINGIDTTSFREQQKEWDKEIGRILKDRSTITASAVEVASVISGTPSISGV